MKASIKGTDLVAALDAVKDVVAPKQTLPILGTVRFELTAEGRLKLAATDLEQGVLTETEASVERPGVLCLGAAKLFAIARELSEETVAFTGDLEKNTAVIKAGGSRFTLMGISPQDFPVVSSPDAKPVATMKAATLLRGLGLVSYAMSTDESRYALNGIRARFQGDRVVLTATDGHRLVEMTVPLETPVDKDVAMLVSRPAIRTITKLLRGVEDVMLSAHENQLVLAVGTHTLVTRLVEGNFPDTEAVAKAPRAFEHTATLDAKILTAALRKTSLLAEERTHPAKFVFTPTGLVIQSYHPDHGEAEVEVPVEWTGGDVIIGFNGGYVLDFLKSVETGPVTLRIGTAVQPMHLSMEGGPESVIMPMRI